MEDIENQIYLKKNILRNCSKNLKILKLKVNLNNQLFVDNLDNKYTKRQYFDYINWLPNDLLKLDKCLVIYFGK